MAKIMIGGVRRGDSNHSIHVVLTESQEVDGQTVEGAIGEAFLSIADGTTPAKAKQQLIDAAQAIMDKHKEALAIAERLKQVEWPEIE